MSNEHDGQPAPPSGPPPPPPWAPPDPATQPEVPTVPQPPAPTGPPAWAPPTGPPAGPPTAPPMAGGDTGWPPPAPPASPGVPVPPAPGASTGKGRTAAIVVGILVVVALVGAAGAFVVFGSRSSELELAIDACELAADGSLRATGTIANRAGATEVRVEVRFLDIDGGDEVDADRVRIELPGDAAERWRASGTAPEDVDQVTCEVTASE
jgi:hypothetical protein